MNVNSLLKNKIRNKKYTLLCIIVIAFSLFSCTNQTSDLTYNDSPDYGLLSITELTFLDHAANNLVVDENEIPIDISFVLRFNEPVGNILTNIDYWKENIELSSEGGGLVDYNITMNDLNKVRIAPINNLAYNTSYRLTVKEGFVIDTYKLESEVSYRVKTRSSFLTVVYVGSTYTPTSSDAFSLILEPGTPQNNIQVTLRVRDGSTLTDGNSVSLNLVSNEYTTTLNFTTNFTYVFKVTSEGIETPYSISVSDVNTASKEITAFRFLTTSGDKALGENAYFDTDFSLSVPTGTLNTIFSITNVGGINNLVPTIDYKGESIYPIPSQAQDFTKDVVYTVTAYDGSTATYRIRLDGYYEIVFDSAGGTPAPSPQYVPNNAKATRPNVEPTQQHYGFTGWVTAPNGSVTFDFDNYSITNKTTIYASYTNKQYTVNFYKNIGDGTPITTTRVNSLDVVPESAYPNVNGGRVRGWQTNGTSGVGNYDTSHVLEGNLSLYSEYVDYVNDIIASNRIPIATTLDQYAGLSELIFSRYLDGASLSVGYVSSSGSATASGTSWANAFDNINSAINNQGTIPTANNIYVILVESGTYQVGTSYALKDHVIILGGVTRNGDTGFNIGGGETIFDGMGARSVFHHNGISLDDATLAGVTISNGSATSGGGMYNYKSSPTLINVVFINNVAGNTDNDGGGGMLNHESSPTLINVTFTGNKATGEASGGAILNLDSSLVLINSTISGNQGDLGGGIYNLATTVNVLTVIGSTIVDNTSRNAIPRGGGIYKHYTSGGTSIFNIVNTILWANNGGNIYLQNNRTTTEASVNMRSSIIQGGSAASTTAIGIRLSNDNTSSYPANITTSDITTVYPGIGNLSYSGGSVGSISVPRGSSAQDAGVYLKGVKDSNGIYTGDNLYYSTDNSVWYQLSDNSVVSLPSSVDDLSIVDARNYDRVRRPDIGSYEVLP